MRASLQADRRLPVTTIRRMTDTTPRGVADPPDNPILRFVFGEVMNGLPKISLIPVMPDGSNTLRLCCPANPLVIAFQLAGPAVPVMTKNISGPRSFRERVIQRIDEIEAFRDAINHAFHDLNDDIYLGPNFPFLSRPILFRLRPGHRPRIGRRRGDHLAARLDCNIRYLAGFRTGISHRIAGRIGNGPERHARAGPWAWTRPSLPLRSGFGLFVWRPPRVRLPQRYHPPRRSRRIRLRRGNGLAEWINPRRDRCQRITEGISRRHVRGGGVNDRSAGRGVPIAPSTRPDAGPTRYLHPSIVSLRKALIDLRTEDDRPLIVVHELAPRNVGAIIVP